MEELKFGELIERRRSIRKFAASEISGAEVEKIVAEALKAPSWNNTEVTRYYAAVAEEVKRRIWGEALPSFNAASTANAAALVAVTFRPGESGYMGDSPMNELGDMWGAYDAGLASAYFILAAKDNGWDSLILGIRNAEKVKAILGIPAEEVLTSVIALGKAAQVPAQPPRKPLAEVLHVF